MKSRSGGGGGGGGGVVGWHGVAWGRVLPNPSINSPSVTPFKHGSELVFRDERLQQVL